MKKIVVSLIIITLFFVTGCGKFTKDDALSKLEKKINSNSYELKGTMQIISNEEKFDYVITVKSLDKKYYKVGLVNQTNNHEQVILKNKDGVYVVTPALNKSFKFQSEWPNNSSQAYILENILKDLKDDENMKFEETEDGYVLKSLVNYPNNTDLAYQKLNCDKDLNIKKIEVFDINDTVKISVEITNINYKAKLDKDDFVLKDLVKEENTDVTEKSQCEEQECEKKEQTTNDIIDEIIYPLYIPSNTYLSNSEKIDLDKGNRVILTFSGEKDFVLVEETSKASSDFEVIPVYGDPQIMSTSVAAVGANSIYFSANNIDYYIASEMMSSEEMLEVASSLGNAISVVESK